MTDYDYDRENANNPDRLYPEEHTFAGRQKYLAKDVEEALPGKKFKVICNGLSLKVCFEIELTAGEKTTLDQAISDHKNNV